MATITVKMEMNLSDFEEYAWGGGAYNLRVIMDKNLDTKVEELINEMFPDEATDEEINDFLHYDEDTIARCCGFSNWEELEHEEEEEEPDEEYESGVTEREYATFEDFCDEHSCDTCPYREAPDGDICEELFWARRDEG